MQYQHPFGTILQGNSLAILPVLTPASVDAVITDPPYCSGAATLAGKQAAPSTKYQQTSTAKAYPIMHGDAKDQRSFTFWATAWLMECHRIAREGSPLLLFTDWRQLPAMTDAVQAADWHWRGLVVWHKPSARPMLGEFRRDAEFIIYASKGRPKRHHRQCLPGVFKVPVIAREKVHLTSKPLSLIMELMRMAPEGGTVLDPFLGGGTTALAAAQSGRRFIGVEMSEEYAQIAYQRLAALETHP